MASSHAALLQIAQVIARSDGSVSEQEEQLLLDLPKRLGLQNAEMQSGLELPSLASSQETAALAQTAFQRFASPDVWVDREAVVLPVLRRFHHCGRSPGRFAAKLHDWMPSLAFAPVDWMVLGSG